MITSTNYAGRTYSLSVTDVTGAENRPINLVFGNRAVSGVQKLIERYIILFLDILGSNSYMPEQGTDLVGSLLGKSVAKSQIQHILNFAASRADKVLLAEENQADPADEQLVKSTAVIISLSEGTLQFSVSIQTAAGATITFLLPTTWATP